jgi:transposase
VIVVAFRQLFSSRGRPAETPWRLALISVLQFAEQLSDREAAHASIGYICSAWHWLILASMPRCSPSSGLGWWLAAWSSACWTRRY